jgi:mono/diheme cytochrome c family protein
MLSRCCILILSMLFLKGCETYNPLQDYELKEPVTLHNLTTAASGYPAEQVKRGKYLAELLACGTCHTDGALVGEPDPKRQFAGSRIGIAYTNPFEDGRPGVAYPPNITPATETGIGNWSDEALERALKSGTDAHGKRHIPVMPWVAYSRLNEQDTKALVAFLRSLPPVEHEVPQHASPGTRAPSPYVHFGVYQSRRPSGR